MARRLQHEKQARSARVKSHGGEYAFDEFAPTGSRADRSRYLPGGVHASGPPPTKSRCPICDEMVDDAEAHHRMLHGKVRPKKVVLVPATAVMPGTVAQASICPLCNRPTSNLGKHLRHQCRHRAGTHSTKTGTSNALSAVTTRCPTCNAIVRNDQLLRHLTRVHGAVTTRASTTASASKKTRSATPRPTPAKGTHRPPR